MYTLRMGVSIWIVGSLLAGCPPESMDDDATPSGDDDSTGDDDATADDDDSTGWDGVYRVVRVCGAVGGDPGDPGPDMDAALLRRDTGEVGYASQVFASNVPQQGNGHPTPQEAIGAEDGAYVSIGGIGSWLDLSFGEDIEQGDLIVFFEVTDVSGDDETYLVLVSYDGTPGSWIKAETVTGAYSAGVGPPDLYLEGCDGRS